MAANHLSLSDAAVAKLKEYPNRRPLRRPQGYCTFDIGHLFHQSDKRKCFLPQTASADSRLLLL